jgi:hypothetical protein
MTLTTQRYTFDGLSGLYTPALRFTGNSNRESNSPVVSTPDFRIENPAIFNFAAVSVKDDTVTLNDRDSVFFDLANTGLEAELIIDSVQVVGRLNGRYQLTDPLTATIIAGTNSILASQIVISDSYTTGTDTLKVKVFARDENNHDVLTDSLEFNITILDVPVFVLEDFSLPEANVTPGFNYVVPWAIVNTGETPARVDSVELLFDTGIYNLVNPAAFAAILRQSDTLSADYDVAIASNSATGPDSLWIRVYATNTLNDAPKETEFSGNKLSWTIQGNAQNEISFVRPEQNTVSRGQDSVLVEVRFSNLGNVLLRVDSLQLYYPTTTGILSDKLIPGGGQDVKVDSFHVFSVYNRISAAATLGEGSVEARIWGLAPSTGQTFYDTTAVDPGSWTIQLRPEVFTNRITLSSDSVITDQALTAILSLKQSDSGQPTANSILDSLWLMVDGVRLDSSDILDGINLQAEDLPLQLGPGEAFNFNYTLSSEAITGDRTLSGRVFFRDANDDFAIQSDSTRNPAPLVILQPAELIVDSLVATPLEVTYGQDSVVVFVYSRNAGESPAVISDFDLVFTNRGTNDNVNFKQITNLALPDILMPGARQTDTLFYFVTGDTLTGETEITPDINYADIRVPQRVFNVDTSAQIGRINVLGDPSLQLIDFVVTGLPNYPQADTSQLMTNNIVIFNNGASTLLNIDVAFAVNDFTYDTLTLASLGSGRIDTLKNAIVLPNTPGIYNYTATIISAIDSVSGNPVEDQPALDNADAIIVQRPSRLNLISGLDRSDLSTGQSFVASLVVTNVNRGADVDSSGTIEITLPAAVTTTDPLIQNAFQPGDTLFWNLLAADTVSLAQIEFAWVNVPIALNTGTASSIVTNSVSESIRIRRAAAINISEFAIVAPFEATLDDTLSTDQLATFEARYSYLPTLDSLNRSARLILPSGALSVTELTLDDLGAADTVLTWTVQMPAVPAEDIVFTVVVRGNDVNTDILVRDTSRYNIKVVSKPQLTYSSRLLAPSGATDNVISSNQTFTFEYKITNSGTARTKDSTVVELTAPQNFVFAGTDTSWIELSGVNSLRTDSVYTIDVVAADSAFALGEIVSTVTSLALDENTGLAATFSDLEVVNTIQLETQVEPDLEIEFVATANDSLFLSTSQTGLVNVRVTNRGDANFETPAVVELRFANPEYTFIENGLDVITKVAGEDSLIALEFDVPAAPTSLFEQLYVNVVQLPDDENTNSQATRLGSLSDSLFVKTVETGFASINFGAFRFFTADSIQIDSVFATNQNIRLQMDLGFNPESIDSLSINGNIELPDGYNFTAQNLVQTSPSTARFSARIAVAETPSLSDSLRFIFRGVDKNTLESVVKDSLFAITLKQRSRLFSKLFWSEPEGIVDGTASTLQENLAFVWELRDDGETIDTNTVYEAEITLTNGLNFANGLSKDTIRIRNTELLDPLQEVNVVSDKPKLENLDIKYLSLPQDIFRRQQIELGDDNYAINLLLQNRTNITINSSFDIADQIDSLRLATDQIVPIYIEARNLGGVGLLNDTLRYNVTLPPTYQLTNSTGAETILANAVDTLYLKAPATPQPRADIFVEFSFVAQDTNNADANITISADTLNVYTVPGIDQPDGFAIKAFFIESTTGALDSVWSTEQENIILKTRFTFDDETLDRNTLQVNLQVPDGIRPPAAGTNKSLQNDSLIWQIATTDQVITPEDNAAIVLTMTATDRNDPNRIVTRSDTLQIVVVEKAELVTDMFFIGAVADSVLSSGQTNAEMVVTLDNIGSAQTYGSTMLRLRMPDSYLINRNANSVLEFELTPGSSDTISITAPDFATERENITLKVLTTSLDENTDLQAFASTDSIAMLVSTETRAQVSLTYLDLLTVSGEDTFTITGSEITLFPGQQGFYRLVAANSGDASVSGNFFAAANAVEGIDISPDSVAFDVNSSKTDTLLFGFEVDSLITLPSSGNLAFVLTDAGSIIDNNSLFNAVVSGSDTISYSVVAAGEIAINDFQVHGDPNLAVVSTDQDSIRISVELEFSPFLDLERFIRYTIPSDKGYRFVNANIDTVLTAATNLIRRNIFIKAPSEKTAEDSIRIQISARSTLDPSIVKVIDRAIAIRTDNKARLNLSARITEPVGAIDDTLSHGQNFVFQALINNFEETPALGNGLVRLELAPGGFIQLQGSQSPEDTLVEYTFTEASQTAVITWQMQVLEGAALKAVREAARLSLDGFVPFERLKKVFKRKVSDEIVSVSLDNAIRPLDLNTQRRAFIEVGISRTRMHLVDAGGIGNSGTIELPEKISTEQTFNLSVGWLFTDNVFQRRARIKLPEGFTTLNQEQELVSTVSRWQITAPETVTADTVQFTVTGSGVDENSGLPVPDDSLVIKVPFIEKALVFTAGFISEPLINDLGVISLGQEFDIIAGVVNANNSVLAPANDSYFARFAINVNPLFGYTQTTPDTVTIASIADSASWHLIAPTDTNKTTQISIKIIDPPRDANTNRPASFTIGGDQITFPLSVQEKYVIVSSVTEDIVDNTSLIGTQEDRPLLGLQIDNKRGAGQADNIYIDTLVFAIRDGNGNLIENPADFLSNLKLFGSYSAPGASLAKLLDTQIAEIDPQTSGNPITVTPGKDYFINAGTIDTIAITGSFSDVNENVLFNLRVSRLVLRQESGDLLITMRRPDQTEILDGDAVTEEEEIENISLLDLDLEKSFVNYPNPFSNADGGTKFHVPLEKAATTVDLKIYTLLGQLVKSENRNVSNQPAPSSYTGITWDGRNDAGQTVLNGVYIGYIKINYEDGSSRVAQTKVMYIK